MTVWMKHPHKNEPPVEVEAIPEALTPYMVQGYQQCDPPAKQPAAPAKGE